MNSGRVDFKQNQKHAASNAGKAAVCGSQLCDQGQEADQQKSPQKILPEMHEMSAHGKEMGMALPSDSEGESKEELEYPGKGATLVDWEEFHKQQIRFVQ